MSEILDIKGVEKQLLDTHNALEGFIEKSNKELADAKAVSAETKAAIDKMSEKSIELADRLAEMEQKAAARYDGAKDESMGEQFIKSESFQAMQGGRQATSRVELKTAIINATGASQPLVAADRRMGINTGPDRVLRIRDVLPSGTTDSNLVEYAKENVFTNNAGPQVGGSPEAFENVTKPESGITFTLASAAVTTLAHWIPASRQVLSDSPMLRSYIDGRLVYGYRLKEEAQLLTGTGANGNLNGIITQATAYAQANSPHLYTTALDRIRDAIRQCHASEYEPDVIMMNPENWSEVELAKDSQQRYLFANPQTSAAPRLWGLPVVLSNSVTAGTAIVMASQSCMIWDREGVTVEVSRENSDNFVKNMVTILVEGRLAFTVYRTAGIVKVTGL